MTANFAFGGFDTRRDFVVADIIAFVAVRTNDFHLKGSGFRVQRFRGSRPASP
jgi:hypothetical protein